MKFLGSSRHHDSMTGRRGISALHENSIRNEGIGCSSDEVLSHIDEGMLRVLLHHVSRDLSTVDITGVERTLDETQHRTLHLGEANRTHRRPSSHMALPHEILAMIFVESLEPQGVVVPSPHISSTPWSLGQVCSTWRAVSRAEPLLWSRVVVRKVVEPRHNRAFSLIDDILVGCGGRGNVELGISPSGSEEWMGLFRLVSSHPARLRGLDLVLDDSCFEALLRPVPAFENLETLSLSYGNVRSPPVPDALLFYSFSTAHSLRSVTIQFGLYPDATDLCGRVLPWARLTDLSLLGTSATSALVILGNCTALVNLKLDILRNGHEIHQSVRDVSLPHLQSISLAMNGSRSVNRLLLSLILPSLANITIRDSYLEEGWLDHSGLMSLLERSACQIHRFSTRGLVFPARQLVTVLRAMPSLTEISVATAESIPNSVLSTIVEEALVPNLQTIEGWGFSSVHSAMDFLNSRWTRTVSGTYTGIKNATFWLVSQAYSTTDRQHYERLLPELRKSGRTVQLRVDEY